MSAYELARNYLSEVYDGQLASRSDDRLAYAVLDPDDRQRFDTFVDEQAERLAAHIRKSIEAFTVDADQLPLLGAETTD
jgi:hypothetical protein